MGRKRHRPSRRVGRCSQDKRLVVSRSSETFSERSRQDSACCARLWARLRAVSGSNPGVGPVDLGRGDAARYLEQFLGHWYGQPPGKRDGSFAAVVDVAHRSEEREGLGPELERFAFAYEEQHA